MIIGWSHFSYCSVVSELINFCLITPEHLKFCIHSISWTQSAYFHRYCSKHQLWKVNPFGEVEKELVFWIQLCKLYYNVSLIFHSHLTEIQGHSLVGDFHYIFQNQHTRELLFFHIFWSHWRHKTFQTVKDFIADWAVLAFQK